MTTSTEYCMPYLETGGSCRWRKIFRK
jgi:hypothetical protein